MPSKPKTKKQPVTEKYVSASNEPDPYSRAEAERGAALVIVGLDDGERSYLATCQKIYRQHRGCTTPFENFIWSLIAVAGQNGWLTPDEVVPELETFRDEWDLMRGEAVRFVNAYPEVAQSAEAS
jgi:hypothetical protein